MSIVNSTKEIESVVSTLLARGIDPEKILKALRRIPSKKTETVKIPNLPYGAILACYMEKIEDSGIHCHAKGWSKDWDFVQGDRGKTFLIKEVTQNKDAAQTLAELNALYEEGYAFRPAPFLAWILREVPQGHFCCPLGKNGMPKQEFPSDYESFDPQVDQDIPFTSWHSPEFTNYWVGDNHVKSLSVSSVGLQAGTFGTHWVYVLSKEVK